MLKKLYQKDGIIHIFDDETMTNNDMKLCYFIINNYNEKKKIDSYKKEYYKEKGFTYSQY
tara:strand:- start:2481 stop:2660 length:180 start_codon:yes stop_codon:yes gene_type:complete